MSTDRAIHARTLPLVLILASALAGCATVGKCESDSCQDDAHIAQDIRAELAQQRNLKPNAISVQTHDHVVYLYGLVASGLDSDTAVAVAREQPGVSQVVNSIAVDN